MTGRYGRVGQDGQRKKEGVWKNFHSQDVVSSIRHYSEGRMNGLIRRYDQSGALLTSGSYKLGKKFRNNVHYPSVKVGRWVSFYSKDSPSFIENYDENGMPNGKFCHWDKQGVLVRCSMITNGNGVFYKYGNQPRENYEKSQLKNGEKHGKVVRFVNGRKAQESDWRNGQKHGLSTTYSPRLVRRENGDVSMTTSNRNEIRFQNGIVHGPSCSSSDQRLSYGDYCKGKRCGVWILQRKGETEKTTFNSKGKKLKTEKYPTPKDAAYNCPLR